jgi:hypothetical protein
VPRGSPVRLATGPSGQELDVLVVDLLDLGGALSRVRRRDGSVEQSFGSLGVGASVREGAGDQHPRLVRKGAQVLFGAPRGLLGETGLAEGLGQVAQVQLSVAGVGGRGTFRDCHGLG